MASAIKISSFEFFIFNLYYYNIFFVFLVLIVIIFITTLVAGAGVYVYKSYLEKRIAVQDTSLNSARDDFEPKLITELISKIDRFKIYKQTFEAYKDNKNYQLSNGKPDIRKIKKEAADKLITEIINNGENWHII